MTTSAERIRAWRGPAILSFGFRPFFLAGGLWATLSMLLWLPMVMGHFTLPTAFDAVSWHAHEFLFGYLGAVMAGFLLTAVPNWTGRLPVTGAPLAGLVALWAAGRLAIAGSAVLPPLLVAVIDLAFPLVFAAVIAREILAGRNWRNLPVLGLLTIFALANAVFHAEAARGLYAAGGYGFRAALATAVMLISLIGGRIIPSFTRNWLVKEKATALPAPFAALDRAVLAITGLALVLWVAAPEARIAAVAAFAAGVMQLLRLARWQGHRTAAEALVWSLHAGYAFLGLGFLAQAAAAIGWLPAASATHLWTAGAIGVMTLAVMTRASLGHSGRALQAGRPLRLIFVALLLAAAARFAANLGLDHALWLHIAGALWLLGFGGFTVLFWPILTRPRR